MTLVVQSDLLTTSSAGLTIRTHEAFVVVGAGDDVPGLDAGSLG